MRVRRSRLPAWVLAGTTALAVAGGAVALSAVDRPPGPRAAPAAGGPASTPEVGGPAGSLPGAASPPPASAEGAGPRQPAQFRSSVSPVTAARLGSSHREGCPVPVADLRLVGVTYRDPAGQAQQGELVVHADVAAATVRIFRALYDAEFPLTRVATVEQFGSDDDRVMAANVTSGYNCRQKTGGSAFSEHAYGRAIDVNPVQNPYVRGDQVLPPAGRTFLDRSDVRPGMVVAGDVVVRAFAAAGWEWGGDFRTLRDYQHFSESGR